MTSYKKKAHEPSNKIWDLLAVRNQTRRFDLIYICQHTKPTQFTVTVETTSG